MNSKLQSESRVPRSGPSDGNGPSPALYQPCTGVVQGQRGTGPDSPRAKRLPARVRNALFAEWAKFSPTLDWECSEREARIRFANEVLFRRAPIKSWSDLTQGEAKRLLREMKERSGSNAAYRAQIIARLAARLWGSGLGTPVWEEPLRERLRQRFRLSTLDSLTPSQAHEMIEELLSRIAREEGREIEELRQEIRSG